MGGSWKPSRLSVEDLIDALEPYEPEVGKYRDMVTAFPGTRERVHKLLTLKAREVRLDLQDPFLPYPVPDSLGNEGIHLGKVLPLEREFWIDPLDLRTNALLVGSPKAGKTTGARHLVECAQRENVGILIVDLRGDYRELATRVPGALLIPGTELRANILNPPQAVPPAKWISIIAARLTWDLGLKEASHYHCIRLMNQLGWQFEEAGGIPTLLDFYEFVKSRKHRHGSSEQGYQERILARLEALILMCGEQVFAVDRGFPITDMLEAGRLVILDLRVQDKAVCDLILAFYLYSLYHKRLHSPSGLNQSRTIVTVLDEQRSFIKWQSLDFGIPDVDLLFSRSRALGLGFIICEQCPSAISRALINSCWLRLGFNSTSPERRVVAELLGLRNAEQAEELGTLPVGQCIARLAGSRIPEPFRLEIPAPGE